ncbi:MAG: glycosyltransferase family 39 protein [Candidatus Limnocylindrales bacterium]
MTAPTARSDTTDPTASPEYPDPTASPSSWRAGRRMALDMTIVAGVLSMVAIGAIVGIARNVPLGWDEAVYATMARSIVTDIPASTGGAIYRPPGLAVIGAAATAPFGLADASLRVVTLVLGLLSLAAIWALARTVWDPVAAVIAVVTVSGAPIVLDQIARFHTDLPSTGLLLVLMALCWHEFERRPEPGRLLLAAAPLAALAFYLRYGTVVAIGGIGLTAMLLWRRQMLRRWRHVAATLGLTILLLLPHIAEAMVLTGSPVGIIRSASAQVNTSGPFVATVQYLRWIPRELLQTLGTVLFIAGGVFAAVTAGAAVTAVTAARRRTLTTHARRCIWLYLPAAITVVGLVLTSHAEPRYVLFPVVLGLIAGAGSVTVAVRWAKRQPCLAGRGRTIDRALSGGIVLAIGLVGFLDAQRAIALHRAAEPDRWLVETGQAIRADAGGSCVIATTFPSIVGWYAACEGIRFEREDVALVTPVGGRAYVMFTDADPRRATAARIQLHRQLVAASGATRLSTEDVSHPVEVYRLEP